MTETSAVIATTSMTVIGACQPTTMTRVSRDHQGILNLYHPVLSTSRFNTKGCMDPRFVELDYAVLYEQCIIHKSPPSHCPGTRKRFDSPDHCIQGASFPHMAQPTTMLAPASPHSIIRSLPFFADHWDQWLGFLCFFHRHM
jgi:hypothetical protein